MLSSTLRLGMFSTRDRIAGFDDELRVAIEAERRRQAYAAEPAGVH